ncbi:N-acetylmuramic acid 6-phosphate etherase [Sphingomonas sp. URHD0057]|uniref:N-acetylmuramic acid 6-phosphate etherase n=1 Tax=Sphingomonas sp. URHD0057 TaxID=1380389 RepID=UPI00048BD9D0|nr:N-acetylmuramic acid 6-phosphate etherase [Sphingomonas sp. URHD0057]
MPTKPLDLWPTTDVVRAMFDGQLAAAASVKSQIEPIAGAAEEAAERLQHPAGRLVYVGAGTSGRLAVLDGAELTPTFGWSPDRIVYGIAGGLAALSRSIENAEDDEDSGRELARSAALNANDVVIGVSASGTTPFTVAAVSEASTLGALTIALASNAGTPLLVAASHPILLDTGDELLSGSTRMKAGTAQKIVLGMLSTAIMLRLGRVHDRLMVDMRVSNRKLRTRAIGIVAQISGADPRAAEAALELTENNIKLATLVAMGMTVEQGARMLADTGNNLRAAITRLGQA